MTTSCWIDGSPMKTGSVQFERMANATVRFSIWTKACQPSVSGKIIMPLYKEQQYSTTRRLSERTRVKQLKKSISFYYVLSANKPHPSVPSDQGFYQSLWDDPDRSNRSLKRKANKRATSPPTKKAKASSPLTRALSPDSPQSSHEMPSPSHEKMPSPSDPQTFQCALDMLVTAWKEKYPTVKFQIGVNWRWQDNLWWLLMLTCSDHKPK
jgi:hypothetical protein